MKLVRDRRACEHPDLLTGDLNDSAIAWVGDQHYRSVFTPKGNPETPLLGIYPMGSPCDQSLVPMFDLAAEMLAENVARPCIRCLSPVSPITGAWKRRAKAFPTLTSLRLPGRFKARSAS